jgi:hypothetical protein
MVDDQPHRSALELVVVPLRHDANNLPSKEGAHETRGGSTFGKNRSALDMSRIRRWPPLTATRAPIAGPSS